MSTRCLPIVLAILFLLPVSASAQEWPEADSSDVASVDAIITAVYDAISGPAGPRDWDRFRSLFRPEARLLPIGTRDGTSLVTIWSVDDYVERAAIGFSANPFFEQEISRTTESFGPLTHAFSTYTSKRSLDDEPFDRGINSFQLLNDGSRWWVVNIMWVAESQGLSIPPKYLPSN